MRINARIVIKPGHVLKTVILRSNRKVAKSDVGEGEGCMVAADVKTKNC